MLGPVYGNRSEDLALAVAYKYCKLLTGFEAERSRHGGVGNLGKDGEAGNAENRVPKCLEDL